MKDRECCPLNPKQTRNKVYNNCQHYQKLPNNYKEIITKVKQMMSPKLVSTTFDLFWDV